MGKLYETGTKVTISFDATVVNDDYVTIDGHLIPEDYLLVKDSGRGFNHALFNSAVGDGITVTVKEEPVKNWPPQEDDVWANKSEIPHHFVGGKFYRKHTWDDKTVGVSQELFRNTDGARLVYRRF